MFCCHLRVTGLVQGVFFRAEAKKMADELGLKGWVKNCPDGSVEIHAEGEAGQLDALEKWCHQGPDDAVVEGVSRVDVSAEGFREFLIQR